MFLSLKIVDWVMLGILLLFILMGVKKGFLGSLIQLFGIFIGFTLVGKFIPFIENLLLKKYDMSPIFAHITSYVILVLVIIIVIKLIIWLMNSLLKLLNLSAVNRALGGVFGVLTGLVFIVFIISILNLIPLKEIKQNLHKNSNYYQKFENLANKWVYKIEEKISDSKEEISKNVKKINKKIDPELDKINELEDVLKDLNDK